jgi:type II secretory pathway pseudopilin PulG
MRLLLSSALLTAATLFMMPDFAQAQDPGMQAAMQAQQATQLANQQAMQAAQQANDAAMQASQTSAASAGTYSYTLPTKFSAKSGTYNAPTTVKLSTRSRGATIYYTTDGWTPTPASPRYRGPITIDTTTTLQAIAVAPSCAPSVVSSAQYIIAGTDDNASALIPPAFPPFPIPYGARPVPVELEFGANVSSQTAQVGDKIPMTLISDLVIDNTVVKQGATATVTITGVDKSATAGRPGVISFEADTLDSAGGEIPLLGGATRQGAGKGVNPAVLVPYVGLLALLEHGGIAAIPKGTPFIAYVDANLFAQQITAPPAPSAAPQSQAAPTATPPTQ